MAAGRRPLACGALLLTLLLLAGGSDAKKGSAKKSPYQPAKKKAPKPTKVSSKAGYTPPPPAAAAAGYKQPPPPAAAAAGYKDKEKPEGGGYKDQDQPKGSSYKEPAKKGDAVPPPGVYAPLPPPKYSCVGYKTPYLECDTPRPLEYMQAQCSSVGNGCDNTLFNYKAGCKASVNDEYAFCFDEASNTDYPLSISWTCPAAGTVQVSFRALRKSDCDRVMGGAVLSIKRKQGGDAVLAVAQNGMTASATFCCAPGDVFSVSEERLSEPTALPSAISFPSGKPTFKPGPCGVDIDPAATCSCKLGEKDDCLSDTVSRTCKDKPAKVWVAFNSKVPGSAKGCGGDYKATCDQQPDSANPTCAIVMWVEHASSPSSLSTLRSGPCLLPADVGRRCKISGFVLTDRSVSWQQSECEDPGEDAQVDRDYTVLVLDSNKQCWLTALPAAHVVPETIPGSGTPQLEFEAINSCGAGYDNVCGTAKAAAAGDYSGRGSDSVEEQCSPTEQSAPLDPSQLCSCKAGDGYACASDYFGTNCYNLETPPVVHVRVGAAVPPGTIGCPKGNNPPCKLAAWVEYNGDVSEGLQPISYTLAQGGNSSSPYSSCLLANGFGCKTIKDVQVTGTGISWRQEACQNPSLISTQYRRFVLCAGGECCRVSAVQLTNPTDPYSAPTCPDPAKKDTTCTSPGAPCPVPNQALCQDAAAAAGNTCDGCTYPVNITSLSCQTDGFQCPWRKAVGWTCAICFLDADGKVDCRGDPNDVTQIVSGAPANLRGNLQISAGAKHACVLTGAGEVVCWGVGSSRNEAVVPPELADVKVLQVYAFNEATCVLKQDSAILCWGLQYPGTPDPADTSFGLLAESTGDATSHACAITKTFGLYCWGPATEPAVIGPRPEGLSGLKNVWQVVTGYSYTCALMANGAVQCWGSLSEEGWADQPVPEGFGDTAKGGPVVKLVGGNQYGICAIFAPKYQVHCWGSSNMQQGLVANGIGNVADVVAEGYFSAGCIRLIGEDTFRCLPLVSRNNQCANGKILDYLPAAGSGVRVNANCGLVPVLPVPTTGTADSARSMWPSMNAARLMNAALVR